MNSTMTRLLTMSPSKKRHEQLSPMAPVPWRQASRIPVALIDARGRVLLSSSARNGGALVG
jgi:hypothetical protein